MFSLRIALEVLMIGLKLRQLVFFSFQYFFVKLIYLNK